MSNERAERVCPPSVIKWLNSPFRLLIQNPAKIMGEYVRPGDTVVDLGCGGGFFSVALAKMVGEKGRVIAVDLQAEMLAITRDFASKKGVSNRITLHHCKENDIGLSAEKVDFALAFYVLHEIPDRERFLKQVMELLKPGAHFMLIEPKHHAKDIQSEIDLATSLGLKPVKPIKFMMSRGMVFSLPEN